MTHVSPLENRTIRHARGRGSRQDLDGLDQPLLMLSPSDAFTRRDAFQNVLVTGGTGSGKTSGSAATLQEALLRDGFGGLVLAAKPDEVELWIQAAHRCGREQSLIIFDETQGFNFLNHDLARLGPDSVGAAVENLMHVLEMCRATTSGGGRAGDSFWQDAPRKDLRNCLPVLHSAHGVLRIKDIIDFVVSAPSDPAQLQDEEWRQSSPMWRTMYAARKAPVHPMDDDEFASIASYYSNEVAHRDSRLRGNLTATISTSLDRFLHGRMNRILCQQTTVVPELIFGGAIIVLNTPSLTWDADGVIAQQIFKYYTQKAILSRNSLPAQYRERPVFIYADEAQNFVNSFDAEFLSMSRSSRCSTVYLTQSLPTLYAKIGGENAKHRTDMLLANFATKIFHNNSCPETNRWAAETVGRSLQRRGTYSESENSGRSSGMNMGEGRSSGTSTSFGSSTDSRGGQSSSSSFGSNSGTNESEGRNRGFNAGESVSSGFSETLDYEIEPADFSRYLLTGGPANGGVVSAFWFQAGKRFNASDRTYLYVSFQQAGSHRK